MLEIIPSTPFKRDLKKYIHKKDIIKDLNDIIKLLAAKKALPPAKRDHSLIGNYVNCRECHVRGDVLLIYKVDGPAKALYLARLGSHSELF